jgi:hypothetical protein
MDQRPPLLPYDLNHFIKWSSSLPLHNDYYSNEHCNTSPYFRVWVVGLQIRVSEKREKAIISTQKYNTDPQRQQ